VHRHQGFTLTPRRDLAALFTAHNTPGPGAYSPFERPITAPSMGIGSRFPGPSKLHPTPGAPPPERALRNGSKGHRHIGSKS